MSRQRRPQRSSEETGEKRRRRRPPEERRKKKPATPMIDLRISVTHDDYLVRVSPADWQKMVRFWILAEETIILRGPYKQQETDLILRGTMGGRVSIRPASDNPLPRFQVILASEVIQDNLENQGI